MNKYIEYNDAVWKYGNNPSREYLEKMLEYVESLFVSIGACPTELNLKNRNRFGQCITYYYEEIFYRVDYIPFDEKPFIVIEYTEDIQHADVGVMWDIEPFPYDLPKEKIKKEILFAFEIEPYPDSYPNY